MAACCGGRLKRFDEGEAGSVKKGRSSQLWRRALAEAEEERRRPHTVRASRWRLLALRFGRPARCRLEEWVIERVRSTADTHLPAVRAVVPTAVDGRVKPRSFRRACGTGRTRP